MDEAAREIEPDDILAKVEALSEELSQARAELEETRQEGRVLVNVLRKVGVQLSMLGTLPA